MKILMFIYCMHCGGAERTTASLANEWVARGADVTVVSIESTDVDFYPLHPAVRRIALNAASVSPGALAALGANFERVRALREVLRELKPDVVLGIMTVASVLAILATRGLPCKVIATEHTHPPMLPLSRTWQQLRRWTFRSADLVVALTGDSKHWLEKNCECTDVCVIPPPFTLPIPRLEPTLMPDAVVGRDRRVLLAVGRLSEEKGFHNLIDAFSSIVSTVSAWDLVIVGEGDERPALQKQIDDADLRDRIHLPGRAGNIADWYERADLYVLSSRFEGFPMALTEAMASGIAAVSYDCDCGPRDIIRHGENGLLVKEVGDTRMLAEALQRLMLSDVERLRLATRAAGLRESFSLDKAISLWRDAFVAAGVEETRRVGA
ncbi:glycosyltransferase family 4 protein [Caballeronia ptereochthonis]|uniref:Group 1 family glycosyl transferase n=1 Tax=Caballeronia ptereochthonis TaxID=1777144 RepID=A0A158B1H9_9BURK|nr:glycosyltransferase family 4 protein [Caballeronia ptereochthonis]SAK63932.1 group 1 family glycosyl transferase [Caballeronia ptereochthonis]